MKVRFEKRVYPLEPVMAVGRGEAAIRLFQRAERYIDNPAYRCLAAPKLFIILGSELPWIEGIEYLGQLTNVYLPTTLTPVPEELFLKRVLRDYGPVAVLGDFTVISMAGAAGLRTDTIGQWREIIEGRTDE